jgi:hypothetical protein
MFCDFARRFLPNEILELIVGCIDGKIIKVEVYKIERLKIRSKAVYTKTGVSLSFPPIEKLNDMEKYFEKMECGKYESYIFKLRNPEDVGFTKNRLSGFKKI